MTADEMLAEIARLTAIIARLKTCRCVVGWANRQDAKVAQKGKV